MKTDATLQKEVMEEFKWEPSLPASQIGVAVQEGIVTLSGYVDNYTMKVAAERATKRIKGVKAVAQEIEVKPLVGRTDEDIARAILSTFEWHSEIPQEAIKIKVQHGTVTLEGEVGWYYQRQAAEDVVKKLLGVKGLVNGITVSPQLAVEDIKGRITEAFKRNALLDAARISVETQGSKVVLKGQVNSWTERQAAEEAAWAAPGILVVEDNLVVES